MSRLNKAIRKLARSLGFDIIRFQPRTHPLARRITLLESHRIDLVLDVGANVGQYGSQLREIGYTGRIVSFEPLSREFDELRGKADKDSLWEVHNFALGDKDEKSIIHVASNSYSSSILDIMPSHINSAPNSEFVDQQEISVRTLDSVYDSVCGGAANPYLKIDTQGFEKKVLEGAEQSLARIATVQVEMSLIPLYRDAPLFHEIYQFLYDRGYRLVALDPAFTDTDTGHLLQVDGVFYRP